MLLSWFFWQVLGLGERPRIEKSTHRLLVNDGQVLRRNVLPDAWFQQPPGVRTLTSSTGPSLPIVLSIKLPVHYVSHKNPSFEDIVGYSHVYDCPRDGIDSFRSCTWTDTILIAVLRVQHLLQLFMSETFIHDYIK